MSSFQASEWQILTCSACGSRMKARASLPVGALVACPTCGAGIRCGDAIPEASPAPPEPDAIWAAEAAGTQQAAEEFHVPLTRGPASQPQGPRPPDEVFSASQLSGIGEAFADDGAADEAAAEEENEEFLQNLAPTSNHYTSERVRVKKRKMKSVNRVRSRLADWDVPLEKLPSAELIADTWEHVQPLPEEVLAETSRREVVEEMDESGNMVKRVKRTQRRRILGLAQMFFRRFSYSTRIITAALAVLILVGSAYFAVRIFMGDFNTQPPRDSSGDFQVTRDFLSSDNILGATAAVKSFLSAPTWDAKAAFVRSPERVRPLMEAWYRKTPAAGLESGEVEEQTKVRSGDQFFIALQLPVHEPDPLTPGAVVTRTRYFMVEEILGAENSITYRVDWETAVNHQEMSFADFTANRPDRPVTFRCKLRKVAYYNHEFSDTAKWQSVELFYPGDEEFHLYAYIPLDRTHGQELSDLMNSLPEGDSVAAVLRLRYPSDSISRSQVIIDSIVRYSWFDAPLQSDSTEPAGLPGSR